jgi:hypothetical protein
MFPSCLKNELFFWHFSSFQKEDILKNNFFIIITRIHSSQIRKNGTTSEDKINCLEDTIVVTASVLTLRNFKSFSLKNKKKIPTKKKYVDL